MNKNLLILTCTCTCTAYRTHIDNHSEVVHLFTFCLKDRVNCLRERWSLWEQYRVYTVFQTIPTSHWDTCTAQLHTSCRLISSLLYFSREAPPTSSTQFWGSCGLAILDFELFLSVGGCFGVEDIRYLDAAGLGPGASREKLRERCIYMYKHNFPYRFRVGW